MVKNFLAGKPLSAYGYLDMDTKLHIVLLITVGFAYASILGALAARFKLPTILGYLLAGFLIGPYSPGFVLDMQTAEQLAEIGVVLMLFGVGLHFKLKDLLNVRRIAIPGALFQTAVSSAIGACFVYAMGWPLTHGILMGLAISVASTVVLVRVLTDNKLQETLEGHISVGWLIVEDIFTVAILVLLPSFSTISTQGEVPILSITVSVLLLLAKFLLLAFLVLGWGYKVVSYLLTYVSRFRSQELFTVTILALTFVIAMGSTALFGTSIALGAFLAGVSIGQTEVRHQAFANALPLRAMFAVIFFLSIGMLFNPVAVLGEWKLFLGILAIIIVVKPLAAYFLVRVMGYTTKVACYVAFALGQIGEFSFILAEQSTQLHLLPDSGYDILVGAAFVSIALNPILFRMMMRFFTHPTKTKAALDARISTFAETKLSHTPEIVIVGFGPLGQQIATHFEKQSIHPLILEHNIDALQMQTEKRRIVYGDATSEHLLEVSKLSQGSLLISTVPELSTNLTLIKTAKHIHPDVKILTRIQYSSEKSQIVALGADYVCAEDELVRGFIEKIGKIGKKQA